jgi:hypothetical protein
MIQRPSKIEILDFLNPRSIAAVRAHARLPTERLLDAILEDAPRVAHTDEFDDDVCLVGMEVRRVGQSNQ